MTTTAMPMPPALTAAEASFVTDRLLVGGDLDAYDPKLAREQLDELTAAGVDHILDTRLEWTDGEYVAQHAPKVNYLHLGVDDDGGTLPDHWFERATDWIDTALADPNSRVLVHCHMGVNRSPSLAFGYLLRVGQDVRGALDAIRTAREVAVIDYADDALAWHHRRTRASQAQRQADRELLDGWRQDNQIDAEQVIRAIRQDESVRVAAQDLGHGSKLLRNEEGEEIGRCWLFQMSAFYASDCHQDFVTDTENWTLPIDRYTDDVAPGDLLLLWRMGSRDNAGLFGYAIVIETDLTASRPMDWANPDGNERLSAAVEAELVFVAPQLLLTRTELKQWPEFSPDRFDLFRMANRPNLFPVEGEHLDRIAELLRTKAIR